MSFRLLFKAMVFSLVAAAAAAETVSRVSGDKEIAPAIGTSATTHSTTPWVGDCDYQQNPELFQIGFRRHLQDMSRITSIVVSQRLLSTSEPAAPSGVDANFVSAGEIPRRSYVDEHILGKMEEDDIPSAPLSSDAEFLRRAHLDLTGSIPTADEARAFLSDTGSDKRSNLIDALLDTPEFVDKWTMYFGDLLKNTERSTNVRRFPPGRNAFYASIRNFVATGQPYDSFVRDVITGSGESNEVGEANYVVGGITPMGPPQDTADTLLVRTATQFLGLSNFDCLLCHSGAGHLEDVNLWAAGMQRSEAWQMSAFFSRTSMRPVRNREERQLSYWRVTDRAFGDYLLNTDFGNRTPRTPIDGDAVVEPFYIFSEQQAGGSTYRERFANNLTQDRQFARAIVNYLWKEMFGLGIVEPADQFDLARLDPANPPPEGWALQPTHPALLEALTDDFIGSGYDLRYFLGLLADSSAYQLSALFLDEWSVEYEAYFARKNVRRLWAEEIHDAITMSTGINSTLLPSGYTEPVQWAMQLPDTSEPRRNRLVSDLLNAFLRGNRDQDVRSGDATILQALNMMNSTFITSRIRGNNPNSTVSGLIASDLTDAQVVEELFLTTLSRFPTEAELEMGLEFLSQDRRQGAEDLQWVMLNKIDFLYN